MNICEKYILGIEEISIGSLLYYQGEYIKSVCEISSERIVAEDPLSLTNTYFNGGYITTQNRVEDKLAQFTPIELNDDILGCLLSKNDEGGYISFIEHSFYTITPSKENWWPWASQKNWELTWHFVGTKTCIPIAYLHHAQNHINSFLGLEGNYSDISLDCWYDLPKGYKAVLDKLYAQ